jgi:XTP/dITP diphosphohydrolase
MIQELIIATQNKHKIGEIQPLLPPNIKLVTLKELGFQGEIPETGNTLADNALQKARFVFEKFGKNCFADDTGLEILALQGRPGVYSARYAGEGCTFQDNVKKVLREMQGVTQRQARFCTVIALIFDGVEYLFEGEVAGEILMTENGNEGFGYDPIFKPLDSKLSFAEMPLDEKNKISHRGRALEKMLEFLKTR